MMHCACKGSGEGGPVGPGTAAGRGHTSAAWQCSAAWQHPPMHYASAVIPGPVLPDPSHAQPCTTAHLKLCFASSTWLKATIRCNPHVASWILDGIYWAPCYEEGHCQPCIVSANCCLAGHCCQWLPPAGKHAGDLAVSAMVLMYLRGCCSPVIGDSLAHRPGVEC